MGRGITLPAFTRSGSVVSTPSGVRGGAPAEKNGAVLASQNTSGGTIV